MTPAERRAAPIQDALNDLNRLKRAYQQALTTPGAIDGDAEAPALAFHDALMAAERAGLEAVRKVKAGSKG